ncbi:hypothetical protein [Kitasatospora sp. NPDC059160]|uniref:hypothetical protein n=1 Tax=Kitasatospora sp. NPDC059160 TaxID=3346748 RepID=UPI0036B6A404
MNPTTYQLSADVAAGLDLAELLNAGTITAMSAGPDGTWTVIAARDSVARPFPVPEHVAAFAAVRRSG